MGYRVSRSWWLVLAFVAGAVALVAAAVGSGPARATTGGIQYPIPKVLVPPQVQTPVLGRFFVKDVVRRAHVMGGMLDMAEATERRPEFLVGELELYLSGSHGQPTIIDEDLYPWEFAKGQLSARIIDKSSLTASTPEGIPIGRLSIKDPRKDYGIANKAKEANTISGELTLNGRGPYQLMFVRGDDNAPPPTPLPKAKQTGRK